MPDHRMDPIGPGTIPQDVPSMLGQVPAPGRSSLIRGPLPAMPEAPTRGGRQGGSNDLENCSLTG